MANFLQSEWILERVVIGGVIRLQEGVSTIGRNPSCTISVASNFVSRNHAEFHVFPGTDHIHVKDLGSTNGIFVNGVQTHSGICNLKAGDRIGVGVSVENEDITQNHQIFILKKEPLQADNHIHCQNGVENDDLEIILPSPEPSKDLGEDIVISDSEYDEDDDEDDFVQPEDIDDNEVPNDIIIPSASPFKVCNSKNKNVVSENIKSIFGNLNPDLLKNLPQNIRGITVPTTVQKPNEEDVVCISSDDEFPDDDLCRRVKSPELFGNSFNENKNKERQAQSSKTSERQKQLETTKTITEQQILLPDLCIPDISKPLEQSKSVETPKVPNQSNENNSELSKLPTPSALSKLSELPKPTEAPVPLQPLTSSESLKPSDFPKSLKISSPVYDDGADEEEQFIFTQMILDEVREELSDFDNEDSPKFNIDEKGDFTLPPIDKEQSLPKKNDVIKLDDDDDEYDEAFESKVNMWTLKLSQSFSNSFNCSQIYEDDIDSVPKIKSEKIFIDNDNDEDEERAVGSDETNEKDVDHFGRNDGKQNPPKKDTALETESPVTRQWKRSSSSNFLFSSSSSDEEENEQISTTTKVTAKPGDIKRSRKANVADEIPKKKTCLDTIHEESDRQVTKTDKSNKKPTNRLTENAGSKHMTENAFDMVKNSDAQKQDLQPLDNRTDKRSKSSDNLVHLNRSTSAPDRRNSSNYKSAKFARSVSTGNQSFLEDLENAFEESTEKKEPEKQAVPTPALEPPPESDQQPKQKPEPSASGSLSRRPPMIIAAPQLPVHKGKLRGVSAVQRKSVDIIKDIQNQKDLKRKFLEKPSIAKRKAELMSKDIKEDRKQKLKNLANKKCPEGENVNENYEKKNKNKHKEKPKVKVTSVNRGAFLAESTSSTTVKGFKIPKKTTTPMSTSSSSKESSKTLNATSPSTTKSTSLKDEKEPMETCLDFSAELLKADNAILQKPSTSTACRERQKSLDVNAEQRLCAPPRRNSKKLTFEAMQQHFEETTRAKEILSKSAKTCNKRSSLKGPSDSSKKKKTVRFNDVPQIRYIDPVARAIRKADKKESTTFNERRNFIRRQFPIVDHTDDLLDDVLAWSHDWMQNKERCLNPGHSDPVIYPMTNQFTSIEQYKSVIFPLLKMEFFAHLEQHLEKCASQPSYKINMDHFSRYKNRELMYARCTTRIEQSQLGNTDLALVNIHVLNAPLTQCLVYISNIRKTEKWSIITMEMMSNVVSKDKWKSATQITVKRIIEGLRVHFGSFNAVHQLSQTPLFQKILNPLELLNAKNNWHPGIEYKGCDPMNPEQKEILLRTYAKAVDGFINPNISLIKGPPGTGKSRLITNLTLQLLYGNEIGQLDRKILICAQSNMAVDVIARQLYNIQKKLSPRAPKYQVIRFGKEDRVNKDLLDITLSKVIQRDQRSRLQSKYESNQATVMSENLSQEIQKLETKIAALEKENFKDVRQDELIELRKDLSLKKSIYNQRLRPEDEKKLYPQYLDNAHIVCTTLSSCVKLSHYVNYFDVCIIDEATQCIEPWTIMPLRFGVNSLIMVGDTQQLPATVLSQRAKDYGLATSLFTRIQKCLESNNNGQPSPIFSLHTQYRMHPEICKWPNMYFYKNELLNSPTTAEFKSLMKPFSILNLDYRQNDKCHSGQISNSLEARFVAKLVKALNAYIPNKYFSYGIITPYAKHREKLQSMITSDGLTNIMVNTIDSYQGIEKDVIIISNARTQGVGFLSNYQRLNVALTRPKKCLILCGNFKNLQGVPFWASLLANAKERGLLHDISTDDALKLDSVIEKIKIKR